MHTLRLTLGVLSSLSGHAPAQIAARRPPRSSGRFLEFVGAVVKKSKEPVVMTAVLKELTLSPPPPTQTPFLLEQQFRIGKIMKLGLVWSLKVAQVSQKDYRILMGLLFANNIYFKQRFK
jgi:hypothetical protein